MVALLTTARTMLTRRVSNPRAKVYGDILARCRQRRGHARSPSVESSRVPVVHGLPAGLSPLLHVLEKVVVLAASLGSPASTRPIMLSFGPGLGASMPPAHVSQVRVMRLTDRGVLPGGGPHWPPPVAWHSGGPHCLTPMAFVTRRNPKPSAAEPPLRQHTLTVFVEPASRPSHRETRRSPASHHPAASRCSSSERSSGRTVCASMTPVKRSTSTPRWSRAPGAGPSLVDDGVSSAARASASASRARGP